MKNLFLLILILGMFSCTKEKTIENEFRFTSITGGINTVPNTGFISVLWSDKKNTSWTIIVKNPDGTIRNNSVSSFPEKSISSLGLDSTYIISIKGGQDSIQTGSFSSRIAGQGDVEIKPIEP